MELPEVLEQVEIAFDALAVLRSNLPEVLSDSAALALGQAFGAIAVARLLIEREMTKRPH
jgi:hypothetical protein